MPTKFDIEITVPPSVEPAGDMPDKWASGLVNNAALIKNRLDEVLPDEGTYNARVAVPSTAKYSPMIDPAFVAQSGRNQANIIRAQYKNLATGFNKFKDKHDLMFATVDGVVAKRFKDQVNNSKDNWATRVAAKTLRATGDRVRGTILGQSLYWITGDFLANQMTNHMNIVAGSPFNAIRPGNEQQFRSAMMGKIVQACIQIITADFLASEILAQNVILADLANAFSFDPLLLIFVPNGILGDSVFQFEYADPEYILHVRVIIP